MEGFPSIGYLFLLSQITLAGSRPASALAPVLDARARRPRRGGYPRRPHVSGKVFDTRWCFVSVAGPFCARPHRDATGCYKTPVGHVLSPPVS
ncbi:hypothetical protein Taro_001958 [Colocasia esculenta]|uniref:Secreted protein n=1 Tax=Colocasia esculenta TaxID=4460 RepID=A0A843TF45_COLES|nr:hypothetical protein [Colocasia esculenta]